MTKTILIVEDDTDILNLVEWHLRAENYTTLTAQNGIKGLNLALKLRPDLIVLDLMLPGLDGLEICKKLKQNPKTIDIAVVMLSARSRETDRVAGLKLGADDYIAKPFSPQELTLRVGAILRRHGKGQTPSDEKKLEYNGLLIDRDSYKVSIHGNEIALTLTEFNLLQELLQNQGKVRPRQQLLDRVRGYQYDGDIRTIDTHIRRLRKKLGGEYGDAIETVRGIGYRFKE